MCPRISHGHTNLFTRHTPMLFKSLTHYSGISDIMAHLSPTCQAQPIFQPGGNLNFVHPGPPRQDPADECSVDFLVRVVSFLPSNSTICIKEKTHHAQDLERHLVQIDLRLMFSEIRPPQPSA